MRRIASSLGRTDGGKGRVLTGWACFYLSSRGRGNPGPRSSQENRAGAGFRVASRGGAKEAARPRAGRARR